nr:hypothetical protein CFP56_13381 [Quercus suber]
MLLDTLGLQSCNQERCVVSDQHPFQPAIAQNGDVPDAGRSTISPQLARVPHRPNDQTCHQAPPSCEPTVLHGDFRAGPLGLSNVRVRQIATVDARLRGQRIEGTLWRNGRLDDAVLSRSIQQNTEHLPCKRQKDGIGRRICRRDGVGEVPGLSRPSRSAVPVELHASELAPSRLPGRRPGPTRRLVRLDGA